MYKVIVFAGTTEGCILCETLAKNRVFVYACVATEYGGKSLVNSDFLTVMAKRLSADEMEILFGEVKPEFVIDATHPYAVEVTQNIKKACENTGNQYYRVLRKSEKLNSKAVYVESTEAAVDYLQNTTGNILLTTGSKELGKYVCLSDYQNRIYARVLSLPTVMETCASYSFEGKHLIGMQGPFSKELNAAILRQYNCSYIVTKDTGEAGGFSEKIEAASECGATAVVIGRPLEEEGMSVSECKKMLAEYFGFVLKPNVILVGIGMGDLSTLTTSGKDAVNNADLLIGARRMVDSVKHIGQDVLYEYRSDVIADYIKEHSEYENISVVLSGDIGFYSGAKKLLELLDDDVKLVCGISSVAYFMSEIGLSWDDAKLISSHGRSCNPIFHIKHNEKVFVILGTKDGVAELSSKLVDYGLGDVTVYVGENLSYENEKIFNKTARELTDYVGDALSVVCIYNPDFVPISATHGIKDSEFVRGNAPMTKEEVRCVSLSKLRLNEDSVCYDIGAGTGSVTVEMALRAYNGRVYAIEKKDEAVELLEINKKKFAADNIEIIKGIAPDAILDLPSPTHAFIGGSSGNLKCILKALLEKNPNVRIVMNCITLETVAETLNELREMDFDESEIVQLGVSRSKELGRYHMMMGENPIYIISCQKGAV